jgi:outer membrane immunogenic protein
MKRLLVAGVVVLGAVAQAAAADLPQPAPPLAQAPVAYIPVAPVYNWGGIYYGINGGYGFGKSDWTDPNNFSPLSSTGNFNLSGGLVGATVGANYQVDALVFGVEGDIDASWMDGKSSSPFCGAVGFGAAAQCETQNNWLATARFRLGYAVDRVLFYGTAGGAFGDIRTGVTGAGTTSSTKAGWTAGAGVEAALADNWTARIEYLFVDLQNATCNTAGSCGLDSAAPVVAANDAIKFEASLIRLGLDYKFR